jgi:hypothetical protein
MSSPRRSVRGMEIEDSTESIYGCVLVYGNLNFIENDSRKESLAVGWGFSILLFVERLQNLG